MPWTKVTDALPPDGEAVMVTIVMAGKKIHFWERPYTQREMASLSRPNHKRLALYAEWFYYPLDTNARTCGG